MEGFSALTPVDISTIVTAGATVVYTVGTFMLWKVSRDTTCLVRDELKNQIAASHSASQHAVLDAHRTLILELLQDESLLHTFSSELKMTKEEARTKFIATLLINHARRIFIDYNHRLTSDSIDSFTEDARELFSLPFIRERWNEVKSFHPQNFRNFVDTRLIGA